MGTGTGWQHDNSCAQGWCSVSAMKAVVGTQGKMRCLSHGMKAVETQDKDSVAPRRVTIRTSVVILGQAALVKSDLRTQRLC